MMSSKKNLDNFLEQDLQAVQNLLHSQNIDQGVKAETRLSENVEKVNLIEENELDHRSPPSQTRQPAINEENIAITQAELRTIIDEFVDVYERLDTNDDVCRKPNYSYTELIFLAIMRSPNFCLPIHEIYLYIETRFNFFRKYTREHWKNAVRHSLSKTRCFTKIGLKQQSKPGVVSRSCYLWSLIPTSVLNFARGDYRTNIDQESGTNTLRWGFYQVNAMDFWNRCGVAISDRLTSLQYILDTSPDPARVFSMQVCGLPELREHEGIHFSSVDQMPSPAAMKREFEDSEASPTRKRQKVLLQAEQPSSSPSISINQGGVDVREVMIFPSISSEANGSFNTSASGSDSETSYTASSHDSGRDTLSDISSPEEIYQRLSLQQHGCLIMVPALSSSPYADDRGAVLYGQHLPDVQFDSIRDIPIIPELPPLQLTFDGNGDCQAAYHSYLPNSTEACVTDNITHFTDCMFQSKPDTGDCV